jgi:hypothetical protein
MAASDSPRCDDAGISDGRWSALSLVVHRINIVPHTVLTQPDWVSVLSNEFVHGDAVDVGDEDVRQAAVLQVGQTGEPELDPFVL